MLSLFTVILAAAFTWNLISKKDTPQTIQGAIETTAVQIEISHIIPEDKTGFIEGTVAYPSDGNPTDLKIYAENISTSKTYMIPFSKINDPNTFTDETKYTIEVPVGTYYVYAMTGIMHDYMSFYSEFVTCGLNVDCPSHDPIKVSVAEGKTTHKIDPNDWHNPISRLRYKHQRK